MNHCPMSQAADEEGRRNAEEAERRERAAEIRRDERMKKIQFMRDMDDSTQVKHWQSSPWNPVMNFTYFCHLCRCI